MKTYLYLSTAIISVSLAAGGEAWAQCVSTQDCATLGYTETSCSNGGIKCPFGNKWFCGGDSTTICKHEGFTSVCTGTGQCGLGESCAGLYKQCGNSINYKYSCSGTGYSGGFGSACNGKYKACECSSGYEWKNAQCQKQVLNGAQGNLYYCNGKVVGVKTSEMYFYVAMRDLGEMNWYDADSQCSTYVFCGNLRGVFPNREQIQSIYNHKSQLNTLLSANNGSRILDDTYWSSEIDVYHYCYAFSMFTGSGNKYGGYDIDAFVRPVLDSW